MTIRPCASVAVARLGLGLLLVALAEHEARMKARR
jgi:hypothetical protein